MISSSLAREDKEVVDGECRGLSAGEISVEAVGVESTVSEVARRRSCGGVAEETAVLAMVVVG